MFVPDKLDGSSEPSRSTSGKHSRGRSIDAADIGAKLVDAQLLRLEALSDRHARMITTDLHASYIIPLALVIALAVAKEGFEHSAELFVLNKGYVIFSFAAGCFLSVMVFVSLMLWLWRLIAALRLGRSFTSRRLTALRRQAFNGALVLFLSVSNSMGHAATLVDPGQFCKPGTIWVVLGTCRWICWNTLLFMMVIDGHGAVLQYSDGRTDDTIDDMPLRRHWKKFVGLWIPNTGVASHKLEAHAAAG